MADLQKLQQAEAYLAPETREERAKAVFELFSLAIKHSPAYAYAYRALGEFFEWVPNPTKAIQCYEKALSLDPKVGCKRALSALQK